MSTQDFHVPTQNEIDAAIREAHALRAEALASWVRQAAHWVAHPGFGHRHA